MDHVLLCRLNRLLQKMYYFPVNVNDIKYLFLIINPIGTYNIQLYSNLMAKINIIGHIYNIKLLKKKIIFK